MTTATKKNGGTWWASAQEAVDADVATQRAAGELHLDPALQAEWYKIQEEAGAKTSKMRADRAVLASQQVLSVCML